MVYKKGKQHIDTPLPLCYNILFLSRYNPPLNASCLVTKVYSHLYHLPAIGSKGRGIALLLYLLHGFFCGTVQLELHYVDVIGSLEH